MAGNNAIQILRVANLASTANASQIPLDGQPFYDKATRKLFVGDGTNVLANYRSLDKGVVAGGLNAPWGSVLNVAGDMGISAPNVRYSYDNASYPQHINVHFPGSYSGESDITLSTDSAPTFCLNTTGIGEFVWQTVPLFINANGYNNDAITLTSSSSSNIVVNAGKSLNLSAANGGIYLNSANINLGVGSSHYMNISPGAINFSAPSNFNISGSGTTHISTMTFETSNLDVNIHASSVLQLLGSQVTLGKLSPGTNTNVFGNNVYINASSALNLHGDNGVTIHAYNEVNINRSGSVISFPNDVGIVALTSQAWVPTYWTSSNRTWIEIEASTSCTAYSGFYYEQPGSEKRFAIDGRLFGKSPEFFLSSTANLAAAYNNMAYGFVTVDITMNAVAYNAGNVGQVHTISTGKIPIFFHPAQTISTQYYGSTQTFNPNSTAWDASQSYSNVVEFVPYIDVRMQGGALLLVPEISYLHGPSRVLNVIVDSVINCTLSGGYIMARADK